MGLGVMTVGEGDIDVRGGGEHERDTTMMTTTMMDGRKWRERDVAAAAVASRRCCAAITTTPTQPTQPAASLAAAASVTRLRLRIPSSTACLPHSSPLDSHSAATSTERSSHSPNLWRTCSRSLARWMYLSRCRCRCLRPTFHLHWRAMSSHLSREASPRCS